MVAQGFTCQAGNPSGLLCLESVPKLICFRVNPFSKKKVPSQTCPELFSFAKSKNITIRKVKVVMNLNGLLHLPISTEAYVQLLLQLTQLLDDLPDSDEQDVWTYIWGSPRYSSSAACKHLIGHRLVHPVFKWLWKSAVRKKHKVFSWLLLKDRLSTRNILKRKNMVLPSYECVICDSTHEETLEHPFLACPYAQSCWNLIHLVVLNDDPFYNLISFQNLVGCQFFLNIIIIMY